MATQFSFTQGGLNFYNAEFDQFKNSPRGEIGQNLVKKVGRPILIAAKRDVGVDTGALRESIYMIHERVGSFQQIRIGSDSDIALLHHNGTRPHMIRADDPQILRFSSRGRVHYSREVMHPGTRPNPYLSGNLYLAYV
jgi:hypothetical protein